MGAAGDASPDGAQHLADTAGGEDAEAPPDVEDVGSADIDIRDGDADAEDGSADADVSHDVITDVDHEPVLSACGMRLVCTQFGQEIGDTGAVRDAANVDESVTCVLTPAPTNVTRFELRGFEVGESTPLFEDVFDSYRAFNVSGGAWRVGTHFLEVRVQSGERTCEFVTPAVTTTPASDQIVVMLDWSEATDNDLHLTRTDRPCWGVDETHHSVLNAPNFVDWGVRFESEDDPNASLDAATGADGPERMYWRRHAEEPWTIGVAALPGDAVGPTTARVRLYDHGRRLLDVSRTFESSAFWEVATIENGRVEVIDDPAAAPPGECTCADGTELQPETCNGLDDDCDGVIDDVDEVCLNQEGLPYGVCAYINEEIGYACF